MLLKDKLDNIKSLLKTDNVLASLEERYCYAEDASNYISDTKLPDLVVFVESIEDVQKVVKYAKRYNIPLVSRGAGTNMVGACTCLKGGIVLNFSKMNKIKEINLVNMTAKVEPGVILGELKNEVENRGLFYPPDPSNYRVSTIGGSIAQASGGAKAFKYGTTKDYILSMKIVNSDGELISIGSDTAKNSSGYHLEQLLIGSEGTLAIIVEAVLKLIPKPETKRTVVGYFNSSKDLVAAVNNLILSNVYPAAIDFMDNNSIKTVEEYLHSGLDVQAKFMLIIELDGFESSISTQIERVLAVFEKAKVKSVKIAKNEDESELLWRARCSSFAAATRLAPDVVSDDIIVPRDRLVEMLEKCEEIADKYSLKVCIVGHAGDANIHPQFVLDLNNEEDFRNYQKAKNELYFWVKEFSGIISAEHGIGIEKLPYFENLIDQKTLSYMKKIKKIFDPQNIFNPGKIFKI